MLMARAMHSAKNRSEVSGKEDPPAVFRGLTGG
jgi:hypothetical protein